MELLYSSGSLVYSGKDFSGVYGLQCHTTSKWNVGESVEVLHRTNRAYVRGHIQKGQSYLYKAIKKYGVNDFSIYKLEECPIELLHDREVYWSEKLNSMVPNGYNLRIGGNGKVVVSEITKKKLSESGKGYVKSKEHRMKLGLSSRGRKQTKEGRDKRSITMLIKWLEKEAPWFCKVEGDII